MLDPQVVVNLLPELVVGVDLVNHGNWLLKDSGTPRDSSRPRLGGIVDECSCGERTEWPGDATPKGGSSLLAVCGTQSRLSYFVALALP